MTDDSHIPPRLLSGKAAAAYCSVTPATFSGWVAAGLMPKPVIGRRWDRNAIDLALDKLSGIETAAASEESPLEKWMREDAVRQALAAETDWERKYEARKAQRRK